MLALAPGDVALYDPSSGRETLLSPSGGWCVEAVNFGHPAVRAIVDPEPLADGTQDRTLYHGARPVGIQVVAYDQDVAAARELLASWHHPGKRPVLRWRALYGPTRRMTVRPDALDAILETPALLRAGMTWVNPSGVAEDDFETTVSLLYASGVFRCPLGQVGGYTPWPLRFKGQVDAEADVSIPGTTSCWWTANVLGEVTDPELLVDGTTLFKINGLVPQGTLLYIDGQERTVVDAGGATWYDRVDWTTSRWTPLTPGGHHLKLAGAPLTGAAVTITFRGAYL